MLSRMPINFVGNVEPDAIFTGQADVTVADGFVGNVALKAAEAIGHLIVEDMAGILREGLIGRIAGMMLRGKLADWGQQYDYASYGGALLLGVQGITVVSHGRSDDRAVTSAISVAYRAVEGGVVEHLHQACGQLVGQLG